MTQQQTPQAGIAEALTDLSEQTRVLVRQEIDAAQREMWAKAKAGAPVVVLVAATGACGLLAAASSYRLSLRLLEKALPPATAAFVALVGYGGATGVGAVAAARRLKQLPAPFPTETAHAMSAAVAETVAEARS